MAPLLPLPRPKKQLGRPRTDDRAALEAIVFVLRSRIPWGIRPASDVTEPIAEGRGPCSAMVASLCESGLTGRT
ncbi:transposase [Corallococcus sp. CA041A]|nr:transposase [Corallococcus sp. CA041A]